MKFDNSWRALFRPDLARGHFDFDIERRIDFQAGEFSPVNALWLAELSRLIYREEQDEAGRMVLGPSRQRVLAAVGMREVLFVSKGGAQGAVLGPAPGQGAAYAVLVFRGTRGARDWLANINMAPVKWQHGGVVARGYLNHLQKIWMPLVEVLETVEGPHFYTGHSMGAALAVLAAAHRPPSALYTFGAPRFSSLGFARSLDHNRCFRVVNNRDLVTRTSWFPGGRRFVHVGKLCQIAADSSLLLEAARPPLVVPRHPADRRRMTDPPRFLADHAPANYVAHLERAAAADV